MINFKHLTKAELAAYSLGTLDTGKSHKIGRHLLTCAECRRLMPMPSVERFWTAIMTDSEIKEATVKDESENFLSSIYSFLKLQSGLLWGGASLVIILSFSFLLWLSLSNSGRELVQNYENDSELKFPLPMLTPTNEKQISSTNSNRAVISSTPRISKTEVPKQKTIENISRQDFNKPILKQQDNKIVATRGVSAKCSENNSIEIEFVTSNENFVFKWKAVPKATKYHLYISDDEEILIDEFETPNETTFVLKKSLDPLKTYKWKIIVTLEDGQQVIGDSQKFTMKDFQTKQKKIETKRSSETRCSANN